MLLYINEYSIIIKNKLTKITFSINTLFTLLLEFTIKKKKKHTYTITKQNYFIIIY